MLFEGMIRSLISIFLVWCLYLFWLAKKLLMIVGGKKRRKYLEKLDWKACISKISSAIRKNELTITPIKIFSVNVIHTISLLSAATAVAVANALEKREKSILFSLGRLVILLFSKTYKKGRNKVNIANKKKLEKGELLFYFLLLTS